jgi:ParB family chromosome partitioning protein
LPEDSAELFAALLAKSQDELVRLLAVCVASTVDVVTPRATPHQPGAELAQAVGLDMAAWWQPTNEGYFRHVPKAAILEAVGGFAPSHVTRLAKLKKADIASEAERLADGTGWMPAIFRPKARSRPGRTRRRMAKPKHRKKWPPWRMTSRRPRLWPRDFAP